MIRLDFRAPGRSLPLSTLLERALPAADAARRERRVRHGAVRVQDRPAKDPSQRVPAGARMRVECERGDLSDDDGTHGGDHARLLALTPSPAWRRGVLDAPLRGRAHRLEFEVEDERNGVAELRIVADPPSLPLTLEKLSSVGLPVLGDLRRGGVLVAGGLRLLSAPGRGGPAVRPASWWPTEPVFCESENDEGRPFPLQISTASRRAVQRGHPWILRDGETGETRGFAPGALVALRDPKGRSCGLALVEGEGSLAARVWSPTARRAREAESVEARVNHALARRRALLETATPASETDAYRLVHGEVDGLPGLAVDRLGPLLRVLVGGRACEGFLQRALDALVGQLRRQLGPDPPIVQVVHLREPPPGRVECVRLVRGKIEAATDRSDLRVIVRERGLAFLVDPGLAHPERGSPGIGLYLDQRDNRAQLAKDAQRGGRWLNLFAHTGAFSVALLAAGADEVVSVDLSSVYLRWLGENLALNEIDASRHRPLRADGRRVLERFDANERFDGIVIDPPTAAAAGRRYWSVASGLDGLVERALCHLAPGGVLFVSRNDRRGRRRLAEGVERAADHAGVALVELREMPPGADFPRQSGFAEGDPFCAVRARRG